MEEFDYHGKLLLAPMVRVGTMPMRMLAAKYGANLVYTEEMVDKRVVASVRQVNERLGTVDFLDKGGAEGGRVMFRTCAEEKPRLVFQLGTADGVGAVAAAQMVSADVGRIDVNMGCPKAFSLQGGMGAALLRKPETAEDILKSLRRNLNLPISCKIRLLDDPRCTVELARRLAACGVCALAVHGRTTQQRPREPACWERIKEVVDSLPGTPVIANGDVFSYGDAHRVRQATGCAAAMLARGAMWNASVFRQEGFLPLDVVQRDYVREALRWDNALPNTKYCLKEMADAPVAFLGRRGGPRSLVGHDGNTAVTRAKDEQQLCALVGVSCKPPYEDLSPEDQAALPVAATAAANGGSGCGKGGKKNRGGPPPPPKPQSAPAQGGCAKGPVQEPQAQAQGLQQQEQQPDQPEQGEADGPASLGRGGQPADSPGALAEGVLYAHGRNTGQPAAKVVDGVQGQGKTGEGAGGAGAGRGIGMEDLGCGAGANGHGGGGTEAGTCGLGGGDCGAGGSLKRRREEVDGEEGAVEEGAGDVAGTAAGGQVVAGGEGGQVAQRQRLER